jgi:hypothetical protein
MFRGLPAYKVQRLSTQSSWGSPVDTANFTPDVHASTKHTAACYIIDSDKRVPEGRVTVLDSLMDAECKR